MDFQDETQVEARDKLRAVEEQVFSTLATRLASIPINWGPNHKLQQLEALADLISQDASRYLTKVTGKPVGPVVFFVIAAVSVGIIGIVVTAAIAVSAVRQCWLDHLRCSCCCQSRVSKAVFHLVLLGVQQGVGADILVELLSHLVKRSGRFALLYELKAIDAFLSPSALNGKLGYTFVTWSVVVNVIAEPQGELQAPAQTSYKLDN